jgi:hypothetical protein
MRRAAILNFWILSGIPWFASVDPVRNGFSILKNPCIQIFMLSSVSEHLGLIFHMFTELPVRIRVRIPSCVVKGDKRGRYFE